MLFGVILYLSQIYVSTYEKVKPLSLVSLRSSSMTKFLFLIGPYPQETGIIRAMETGNTSPSLSSPPPSFSPSSSLSHPPRLSPLRCAFICTDYQVQRLRVRPVMSPVMVIGTSYILQFTGNESMTCAWLFCSLSPRKQLTQCSCTFSVDSFTKYDLFDWICPCKNADSHLFSVEIKL